MSLIAKAPRFLTGKPDVISSENGLSFSLPLINRGTGPATNVRVTDITLESATRLSPAAMPVFLGTLAVHNFVPVNARFDSSSLIVGGRYLIVVRGTYESGGVTYGFEVNHRIAVPQPVTTLIKLLKARAEVTVKQNINSYTLFNDEPLGSPQYIHAFSLDVVAPITVIRTPYGWEVETDNKSYVLWYTTGQQLPDPYDIAPSTSLGGFEIQSSTRGLESTGFSITAWNHQTNQTGLVSLGAVLSPSRMN